MLADALSASAPSDNHNKTADRREFRKCHQHQQGEDAQMPGCDPALAGHLPQPLQRLLRADAVEVVGGLVARSCPIVDRDGNAVIGQTLLRPEKEPRGALLDLGKRIQHVLATETVPRVCCITPETWHAYRLFWLMDAEKTSARRAGHHGGHCLAMDVRQLLPHAACALLSGQLYRTCWSGDGKPEIGVKRAMSMRGIVFFTRNNSKGGPSWVEAPADVL